MANQGDDPGGGRIERDTLFSHGIGLVPLKEKLMSENPVTVAESGNGPYAQSITTPMSPRPWEAMTPGRRPMSTSWQGWARAQQ